MSLLLAPYNDSMRLGMGFNSYTQTMCVDNAVKVTDPETRRTENPSQVVTYSSKFVESLGEVVGSMNISYSTSIRKGTVEVAGSSNSIQEDKIKQSDLNAVVNVKVVNQTEIINENCEFQPLEGVVPGTKDFDDAFGDCYISGFIEGGDFNGIISIRVIDRTKTEAIAAAIKKSLSSGSGKEFTLDMDTFSAATTTSNAMKETETTISVSWMGGGQIKDPKAPWDVNSIFAAAAAFPNQVAKCPQKTWAILTKYRANRSFQAKLSQVTFSPLEYDAVASYTVELFESFMEYKQLMKLVQDIMTNTSGYQVQKDKHNAIGLDIKTLVAVKAAFRQEMSKIVQAVSVLAEDPNSLKRNANKQEQSNDAIVRQILLEAFGSEPWQAYVTTKAATTSEVNGSTYASKAGAADTANKPKVQDPGSAVKSTTGAAADLKKRVGGQNVSTANDAVDGKKNVIPEDAIRVARPRDQIDYNFSKLLAPEVWSDVLPIRKSDKPIEAATATRMPDSMGPRWAHPPVDDSVVSYQKSVTAAKLTIHAAACGMTDVTDQLRKLIKDDQTLQFTGQQLFDYAANHEIYLMERKFPLQVGIIYQYTDQPMRLKVVRNPAGDEKSQIFTIDAKATDLEVKPSPWNADTWSITAVTYGGKCYNDDTRVMDAVQGQLRTLKNDRPQRTVMFTNDLVSEDTWPWNFKLGMIFYQVQEGGRMRVAVGLEDKLAAVMSDDLAVTAIPDESKIRDLKKQCEEQQATIAEWTKKNGETQSSISTLEKSLADARNELSPLRNTAESRQVEINGLNETIKKLRIKGNAQSGFLNSNRDCGAAYGKGIQGWCKKSFDPPYTTKPILLTGLRSLDWQMISSSFCFGFQVTPSLIDAECFGAIPWSSSDTAVSELEMSWLALPADTGHNIQSGEFQTGGHRYRSMHSSPVQATSDFSYQFLKEFNDPPKVVCWLMSVDLKKKDVPEYDIRVRVASVSARAFKIVVETTKKTDAGRVFEEYKDNVKIGWLAYDASLDGKQFKTLEFSAGENELKEFRAYYGGSRDFPKTPALFSAISRFGFNSQSHIRAAARTDNPDAFGSGFQVGKWLDSVMFGMTMLVIAVDLSEPAAVKVPIKKSGAVDDWDIKPRR